MLQLKNIDTVYGGKGVWQVLEVHLKAQQYTAIFILTDTNTHKHCLPLLMDKVDFPKPPVVLQMPAGEDHKTIESCMALWEELSQHKADRGSLLINLGGGVVTDLGGFVASTFKRGIDFINIPTSLLAMVDAAVGGKNGVDLGSLKNQIGVINEPALVLLDTFFLKSLPKQHLTSGMAEMLKHGLIASEDYFDRVVNADLSGPEAVGLIWESVEIKHGIVTKDPTEQGLRKSLNFGHTLGHAIESYFLEQGPQKMLLHGEAIAVGMILASYFSAELLGLEKEALIKISKGILKHFRKLTFIENDIEHICELLIYDKKNLAGKINFVLLKRFGSPQLNCEVPNALIVKGFDYYKNF